MVVGHVKDKDWSGARGSSRGTEFEKINGVGGEK